MCALKAVRSDDQLNFLLHTEAYTLGAQLYPVCTSMSSLFDFKYC